MRRVVLDDGGFASSSVVLFWSGWLAGVGVGGGKRSGRERLLIARLLRGRKRRTVGELGGGGRGGRNESV